MSLCSRNATASCTNQKTLCLNVLSFHSNRWRMPFSPQTRVCTCQAAKHYKTGSCGDQDKQHRSSDFLAACFKPATPAPQCTRTQHSDLDFAHLRTHGSVRLQTRHPLCWKGLSMQGEGKATAEVAVDQEFTWYSL